MTQILTITDLAAKKIKELLEKRGEKCAGVRLGIKTEGCSGLSYKFDYAQEIDPQDEVIEYKGVTLLVDKKAALFVTGVEIDYNDDLIQPGFVFKNPNEKGRCGCGKSFKV